MGYQVGVDFQRRRGRGGVNSYSFHPLRSGSRIGSLLTRIRMGVDHYIWAGDQDSGTGFERYYIVSHACVQSQTTLLYWHPQWWCYVMHCSSFASAFGRKGV